MENKEKKLNKLKKKKPAILKVLKTHICDTKQMIVLSAFEIIFF